MILVDRRSGDRIPTEEDYAIVFDGLVEVERDDLYSLSTSAYNTSVIYVGDQLVTDLPLWRNVLDAFQASGMIPLAAGKHPLRVVCFQRKGLRHLNVGLAGQNSRPMPHRLWRPEA